MHCGNRPQIYTKRVPFNPFPARIVNTPAPSFTQELLNLFLRIAIVILFIVAIAFGFATRATATVEDEQLARAASTTQLPSPPAGERKLR